MLRVYLAYSQQCLVDSLVRWCFWQVLRIVYYVVTELLAAAVTQPNLAFTPYI